MCGFAGFLNLDGAPASADLARGMSERLAHRGPDGDGVWNDGPFAVGHRRLAVLDPRPEGRQPMSTRDGRWTLAYNGEIFNFREIRGELEKKGRRFHTGTDTEVLLEALACWGTDVVPRLNGMFAFAAWDAQRKTLVLARDRYGVKPLYHARVGRSVLFASEVKAFLAHPGFRPSLDVDGLVEYLTFQNFFTERTLFQDVSLFPPGSIWTLSLDGEAGAAPRRYWDFQFVEPDRPASDGEYEEELARLFRQAVERQLVSDVPLGGYLSGGVDSGSITAVASPQIPNFRTFTAGFDLRSASGVEMGFDERAEAERISYLLKTEQYEMVLKAGDMERVFPRLAWHVEEPRVGQSYPNFYTAQLASKFVKVVLSGAGGDELFGGYPWRYYRAVVNDDFDHYTDKYFAFWQRLIPPETMASVLSPVWDRARHVDARSIFKGVLSPSPQSRMRPEDYVNQSLRFEAKTFLHGLLVVEDKLSMAHGLETRVPFLDNDLVDFAQRVPVRLKLGKLTEVVRLNENEPGPKTRRYFQNTRDGKLLLRKTLARFVPAEVAQGEKKGFSAPDGSWFRGESIDYVRRRLLNPRARIYQFLDPKPVGRLIHDHVDGRENRRLLIWSLLSLEQWCETFLEGGPSDAHVPAASAHAR